MVNIDEIVKGYKIFNVLTNEEDTFDRMKKRVCAGNDQIVIDPAEDETDVTNY